MARRQPCCDHLCLFPDLRAIRFFESPRRMGHCGTRFQCGDGGNGPGRNPLQPGSAANHDRPLPGLPLAHGPGDLKRCCVSRITSPESVELPRGFVLHRRGNRIAHRHACHPPPPLDRSTQCSAESRTGNRPRLLHLQRARPVHCVAHASGRVRRGAVSCRDPPAARRIICNSDTDCNETP